MKILYFTPYFPPQSEAAATRSYWFIKTLQDAGHDVQIIQGNDLTLELPTNMDRALVRLTKENLAGLELFFRIMFSSKKLTILSSPPFFTVCWGAFACILKGQKYILDIRDLYPEIFFELKLINENSFFGKLAKTIVRVIYKRAFKVITVTQGIKAEISAYGTDKVELIMNGYDANLFRPGMGEKLEKFTLIFHGNLGKIQNMQTLLKLAKLLEPHDDIEILVAGEGPKAQEIISAGRKNIKYLGKMSYEAIPPLLQKCHVGLSFRTDDKIGRESFPVKVFEYIGTGLPVIMSPKGEAGEIVERLQIGKEFDNSDVSGMMEEVLRLKKHPVKMQGDHDEFSRSKQSKKILEVI